MQRKWVEAWCLHMGKEKQHTAMKPNSRQVRPLACGVGLGVPRPSVDHEELLCRVSGLGVLLLTAADLLIAPGVCLRGEQWAFRAPPIACVPFAGAPCQWPRSNRTVPLAACSLSLSTKRSQHFCTFPLSLFFFLHSFLSPFIYLFFLFFSTLPHRVERGSISPR